VGSSHKLLKEYFDTLEKGTKTAYSESLKECRKERPFLTALLCRL
jgi:hypothetical protein